MAYSILITIQLCALGMPEDIQLIGVTIKNVVSGH